MACPHLEYRNAADGKEFDHQRPYCTVADAFVSPMRADICNVRHGFHYEEDCEIYHEVQTDAESQPAEEVASKTDD